MGRAPERKINTARHASDEIELEREVRVGSVSGAFVIDWVSKVDDSFSTTHCRASAPWSSPPFL